MKKKKCAHEKFEDGVPGWEWCVSCGQIRKKPRDAE